MIKYYGSQHKRKYFLMYRYGTHKIIIIPIHWDNLSVPFSSVISLIFKGQILENGTENP
jgi:hypothetical protein